MERGIHITKEGKVVNIIREVAELDIITFHQFGIELQDIFKANTELIVLYDATKVNSQLPGEVKLGMVQWIKDNESLIKRSVSIAAIIVPSFISRVTLKGILSVKNLPIEYKVFHNRKCALGWLNLSDNG